MLSCWDIDPEQRPTFAQLVTTITSVLDPLADYLDVTTFVTGEEQETEMTITESQLMENEEHTSQEEWQTTDTLVQAGGYAVKNEEAEKCTNEEGAVIDKKPLIADWTFIGQTVIVVSPDIDICSAVLASSVMVNTFNKVNQDFIT